MSGDKNKKAKGSENKQANGVHLDAVRKALEVLTLPPEESKKLGMVKYEEFLDPLSDKGEKISLPCDLDRPPDTNDLGSYLIKQMEYVQTFLVVGRLEKELHISLFDPRKHNPVPHIERILKVVGHGFGTRREEDEKKYYPYPHLRTPDVKVPFVDFAGFLIVLFTDYVRWEGSDSPLTKAVRAEMHTAFDFLIDPDTYIQDGSGIGWGFIPGQRYETDRKPLFLCRHVFPTARAIVAIWRYAQWKGADPDRIMRVKRLLPGILKWMSTLARGREGMFYASEENTAPYFADHIYATEALLSLAEFKVKGAKQLAVLAVDRFLGELDKGKTTVSEFERPLAYRIEDIKGINGAIGYTDRATWATCLAVLSQGVSYLRDLGEEGATRLGKVRKYCDDIAWNLLVERRNSAGLWPDKFLQFHWVLSAVEALLRYSRDVPPKELYTTVEQVGRAADRLLADETFSGVFRQMLIGKIQELVSADKALKEKETDADLF